MNVQAGCVTDRASLRGRPEVNVEISELYVAIPAKAREKQASRLQAAMAALDLRLRGCHEIEKRCHSGAGTNPRPGNHEHRPANTLAKQVFIGSGPGAAARPGTTVGSEPIAADSLLRRDDR